MNFAVGSIIIILLLIPGLLLRRAYYSFSFSRHYIPDNLTSDLINAIVPSFIIHFSLVLFLAHSSKIDFTILGVLLSSCSDSKVIGDCYTNISENLDKILKYNCSIWLISILIGHFLRIVVKACKFDIKIKAFRYQNEWHYILSGEICQFPSYPSKEDNKEIEFKILDVLVKGDKKPIIYTGILVDYQLSKDGNLDTVILSNVKRRSVEKIEITTPLDPKKDYPHPVESKLITKDYKIPGAVFAIPAINIININIHYWVSR